MNMQSIPFVAVAFILVILLNRILAVPQQIRLNKDLIALKKRGPVSSVGLAKSFMGARVAVLICDKTGQILEAYRISGRSIASGYSLDQSFPYTNCFEAKSTLEQKKKLSVQERAYLSAATYLVEGLSNAPL